MKKGETYVWKNCELLCSFDGLTATRISVNYPHDLASSINVSPYLFKDIDTLSVQMKLYDPENNVEQPKIELHTSDTVNSVINLNGKSLESEFGFFALANSQFMLSLTYNRIHFVGKCKKAYCTMECSDLYCAWLPESTCTTSLSWTNNDTLFVSAGNDTLRIVNDVNVSNRNAITVTGNDLHKALKNAVKSLQYGYNTDILKNEYELTVYNLKGDLIDAKALCGKLRSGVYIASLKHNDNMVKRLFQVIR